ncbi:unnamed protein product [Nippostrongylus brasiliensis]|uniref:Malic enzyme n=1 Tax=Nippostrongylus brasiliensis TaxID=27835 RepID=A0A0N4Y7H8_NIPBR|nr:unnamed protein product [Nippostrongylus brasiliensis]
MQRIVVQFSRCTSCYTNSADAPVVVGDGASTVAGAFTEEVLREMSRINSRPIVFALSNPTSKAECTADAAYRISNGSVLFASGSPFDNVELNGKLYKPGQGNNAYIFPGIALGCVLFKAKHIPDKLFLLAARRVAESVTEKSLYEYSRLYPRLKSIRELSIKIAVEVGDYLYKHNLATLHPRPEDMEMFIRQHVYSIEYQELINKTYDWPAKDAKHGFPTNPMGKDGEDPFAALKKMSPPSKEHCDKHHSHERNSKEFNLDDPQQKALHKLYRPEIVTPKYRGVELLKLPWLNKGLAFTLYERQFLGIHGLLPPAFMTAEQQACRVLKKLREQPDDLARYVQLDGLQDRNERLFYRVLCDNIKELMRIVYTPTVGLACQKFGFIYRHPKYVAIVVTDGERILGLGDLGAYGMGIPIGKLALYVALGGVHPEWCLPILLDVGTDNEKLLKDPFYTGLRKKRIRGAPYDKLLDNFMIACTKRFGRNVLIQFEDFGNLNAYRLLDKYKKTFNMFNDDIQGTAAVVLAGLLTTMRITKKKLSEQKFLFFGAGGAATGVAEMCVRQMVEEGASVEEACENIYMVDIEGLLTKSRAERLSPRHSAFAKDMEPTKDLLKVVKMVQPNALIVFDDLAKADLLAEHFASVYSVHDDDSLALGFQDLPVQFSTMLDSVWFSKEEILETLGASTVGGAFTDEIIKEMAEINERPIIFALSNPTSNAECTAKAAIQVTKGAVLFASGSPFENVEYDGKTYKPGQGNNAYIFPGIGLGAVLFRSKHVTDKMFLNAARIVAESVTEKSLYTYSRLYPRLKDIREISIKIAIDAGHYLYHHGLATLYPEPDDMEMYVRQHIYSCEYQDSVNRIYDWPEGDAKHGYPTPKLERLSMEDE